MLLLLVENGIAGLAEVRGPPFHSTQPVWDNGIFPHRIPLLFTHATLPELRIPALGDVRDVLKTGFKAEWGLGILNQWLMEPAAAEKLVKLLRESPNHLSEMKVSLPELMQRAKLKRDAKPVQSTAPVKATVSKINAYPVMPANPPTPPGQGIAQAGSTTDPVHL